MADRMKLTETATGNGSRPDALPRGDMLRVEPPVTAPRRRLPELVLGIFLVAGCALLALLLAASGRERTPALALARNVQRGEVITADDLRTVYVGSDIPIATLGEAEENQVVGRAALTGLQAGTLVTPDQFAAPSEVLEPGDGVVGLSLEVGEMPSLELAPGDVVNVVAGGGSASQPAEVVARDARVVSVERVDDDESGQLARWLVSVRATEDDATEIAMAASGDNPVQLVLVQR
jgi:hypothetical protein